MQQAARAGATPPDAEVAVAVPDVASEPETRPVQDSDDVADDGDATLDLEEVAQEPVTRDLARQREWTRGALAVILASTFAALILIVLLATLFGNRPWEEVRDPVTYLIATLSGLLGAALGFYFSTTSGSEPGKPP